MIKHIGEYVGGRRTRIRTKHLVRFSAERETMSRLLHAIRVLLNEAPPPPVPEPSGSVVSELVVRTLTTLQSLTGRFYPFIEGREAWTLPAPPRASLAGKEAQAVPPKELWAGYCDKAEDYLATGKRHTEQMVQVLGDAGCPLPHGGRILDFGCAAGRMTRWLLEVAPDNEIWGCDVRSRHVLWCQQHLDSRLRFVTTTTAPHLPFDDEHFNLVYACSVFTHIGELEDMWLLELRRVLKRGGVAFLTVHDSSLMRLLLDCPRTSWLYDTPLRRDFVRRWNELGLKEDEFGMLVMGGEPGNTQVFHDTEFLKQRWGQFLDIKAIVPSGHDYQTAVVATRP
jgi:SAM-dependent methyltransferase